MNRFTEVEVEFVLAIIQSWKPSSQPDAKGSLTAFSYRDVWPLPWEQKGKDLRKKRAKKRVWRFLIDFHNEKEKN